MSLGAKKWKKKRYLKTLRQPKICCTDLIYLPSRAAYWATGFGRSHYCFQEKRYSTGALDLFLIIKKSVLISVLTSPNAQLSKGTQSCSCTCHQFQFYYKAFLLGEKYLGICQVFIHQLVIVSFPLISGRINTVIPLSVFVLTHIAVCLSDLRLNRISKLLMHQFCYPMI